jgi:hypothetical protein
MPDFPLAPKRTKLELASVNKCVCLQFAISVELPLFKLTCVSIFIDYLELTLAMHYSIEPLAGITRTCFVDMSALPVLFVIQKITFIKHFLVMTD